LPAASSNELGRWKQKFFMLPFPEKVAPKDSEQGSMLEKIDVARAKIWQMSRLAAPLLNF